MPFYRFIIHGTGVKGKDGVVGFYTGRWAHGATMEIAAQKALKSVRMDWLSGRSSKLHNGPPPKLEIDKGYQIQFWEIYRAPNRGNILY